MRCANLAQDRVDSSEAIKCLARAMSKPIAGHMTQLKRVARYVEGVPRKALPVPLARAKQSALGSARGQRFGWRHSNASEHVLSDCAERTTLAQTQLKSIRRDWTSVVQKVRVQRTHKGRVFEIVSGKACFPTGT